MKLYKKILMGIIISIIVALGIWMIGNNLFDNDISSRAKKVFSGYQKNISRDVYG